MIGGPVVLPHPPSPGSSLPKGAPPPNTTPAGKAELTATILCRRALLPTGWADDVLLEIDGDGALTSVRPDAAADAPAEAERLTGPCLPGVPNVHSHAFQRAMAGLAERGSSRGDSFWTWRERMYHFVGRLGPDDIQAVAAQLYVEMLEAGYTSVGEFHYLHHDPGGERYADPGETSRRIVTASREAGIGLAHLPVLYMTGDFGGAPAGEGQRRFLWDPEGIEGLLASVAAELSGDADRRVGLALHSLRAVPPEAMGPALDGLRRVDPAAPVHIHVAEQTREVEACLAWSGTRPVRWLLEHADVDGRWCLVHATHMEPGEARDAARSGATAGLCPTTEANLGDGIFPLRDWLAEAGAIGVGSDSHVSVSPVEELRWLEYGQRLASRTRNVAAGVTGGSPEDGEGTRSTGRTLLQAAVAGGERALRRGAGGLAPGARADLVVLDPTHPALAARDGDDLVDAWLFAGNTPAVRDVMVGGRWVVREGRHPRREEIAARYREVAARLS